VPGRWLARTLDTTGGTAMPWRMPRQSRLIAQINLVAKKCHRFSASIHWGVHPASLSEPIQKKQPNILAELAGRVANGQGVHHSARRIRSILDPFAGAANWVGGRLLSVLV